MEQKRKIIPPIWLVLTLSAMTGFHFLLPIVQLVPQPWSWAGAALIVIGITMAAISARWFRRAGTPVMPFEKSTALVTGGFYRHTRNPMYFGMFTLLIGAGVLFGDLGSMLPIPVFMAIIAFGFVRGEERFLAEIFGEEYLAYKRKVRRWL